MKLDALILGIRASFDKGLKMSCNFNAVSCQNCPKYNGCLLQIVYSNTLSLATMIDKINVQLDDINNRLNTFNPTSFTTDDNVELFNDLENIHTKLDNINKLLNDEEERKDEKAIDFDNIKSTIDSIDTKLDDLITSYNSYEYVPIISKDE